MSHVKKKKEAHVKKKKIIAEAGNFSTYSLVPVLPQPLRPLRIGVYADVVLPHHSDLRTVTSPLSAARCLLRLKCHHLLQPPWASEAARCSAKEDAFQAHSWL